MGKTTTSPGLKEIFNSIRFLSLLILGLCEFVRGALLFFILPIYVRGALGLEPSIVGYALAAHYTVDTSLRGPSGWLTDRFGQRNVLLVALGLGWLGLWFVVRAQGSFGVVLGCALLGIGMASVWPAVISRVTQGLTQDSHATAMGGVYMAWLVGVGSGTVTMGWLLGNNVRSGFASLLIVWVGAGLLTFFAMRKLKVKREGSTRLRLRAVVGEARSLRLLFPGMFVQTFAMGLLLPVFVLYARYELGISGQTYSYLLVLGGAATVLLQLPLGRLIDRLGYKLFLVPGLLLAAVTIVALIHLQKLQHIAIAVVILGTAYALILPSWNSVMANSISERRRAVMWGIFMTVEGLGMAVGPFLGGQLWTWFAPSTPFYLAAGTLLATMVFYIFAPLKRLFRQREVEETTPISDGKAVS